MTDNERLFLISQQKKQYRKILLSYLFESDQEATALEFIQLTTEKALEIYPPIHWHWIDPDGYGDTRTLNTDVQEWLSENDVDYRLGFVDPLRKWWSEKNKLVLNYYIVFTSDVDMIAFKLRWL